MSIIRKSTYGHDPLHYPIKALAYTVSHPSLWRVVFWVFCLGFALAVVVLVVLFKFALEPQAALINADLPWWAWLLSVLLVLLESAAAVTMLVSVAQSKTQRKLFAATMRLEGRWKDEMVAQSTVTDLNLVKKAHCLRFATFPIQIIPVAGGAIYAAFWATFTGWDYMDRYFDAIKLPVRMQRIEVFGAERSDYAAVCSCSTYNPNNEYTRFGFMVGFLESIPIAGTVLFPLTNAVAAALFAVDIEKEGGPVCMRNQPFVEQEGNIV